MLTSDCIPVVALPVERVINIAERVTEQEIALILFYALSANDGRAKVADTTVYTPLRIGNEQIAFAATAADGQQFTLR